MQLELFAYDQIEPEELDRIYGFIKNAYWHIRNLRVGRFSQAKKRRYYRMVAGQKKRLLLAGVSKREVLDFLSCCRLQCAARKQPFKACSYCGEGAQAATT